MAVSVSMYFEQYLRFVGISYNYEVENVTVQKCQNLHTILDLNISCHIYCPSRLVINFM